ncbi:transmembrane protein 254 isoform X2 [Astyanax mexicanus]|uniref:Transmembrane protein 254 n=1 Tax=Astyanax mexicanus TaxID=7994 RepID=A0A3B1KEB1_ASTMX|nr:transmembrane protein 254 isoform X2 [Astyanax mexicanus]
MAKSNGSAYFRMPSFFWTTLAVLFIGYYTWAVFWPQQVPYDSLGPLGAFTKHLVNEHYSLLYKGWWAVWAIHTVEALVGLKICGDKGIDSSIARLLWFSQTVFFGFASLGLLIKYKPDRRSKQQ